MKSKFRKYAPRRSLFTAFLVLFATSAFAADKNIITNPGQIFAVNSGKRSISCVLANGAYLSGKSTKDSKFKLATSEIDSINLKIKKLKIKRSYSLINAQKKKLKAIKKRIKADNQLCTSGAPAPTPSATPAASGDAFSMAKLDRALTAADVRNLVTRAGFGYSAKEEWLIPVALNGGVDALVDQFMAVRAEDPGVRERVEDMTDEAIASSTTQTPTVHTLNRKSAKLYFICGHIQIILTLSAWLFFC